MKIYLKLVYLEIFHLLDDLGRHHWQSCTHNQNSIQTLVPPHPLNNKIINIYGIKLYSCTSGMSGNVPGGGKAKLIPPNLISPGLLLSSSFTLKLSTWAYILASATSLLFTKRKQCRLFPLSWWYSCMCRWIHWSVHIVTIWSSIWWYRW